MRASARGMSRSAASAPHDIAKAALTMPKPNASVPASTGTTKMPARIRTAGILATTTKPRATTLPILAVTTGIPMMGSARSSISARVGCSVTPRPAPHRSAVWYGPEVWLGRLQRVPARPRQIAEYVDLTFAHYGRQLLPSGTLRLQATRPSGFVPQKAFDAVD